ncbi:pirin family protein [Kiloniella sp. b19]|uniref:pirin family protein n=1 Tax=Kiloniella sp. GXU_MW_B19 TaxID=3141326 RepID=UPI0031E18AF5
MLKHSPFESLGRMDIDWLSARYHFSFANYHNPERMGFGPLRVWNDDTIKPGSGFPMHGHRDMEIITYVRKGAITHEDHLGNRGRTEAGDIQVMSAGKGIMHSEYNHESEDTLIFQIWVEPDQTGLPARWEQRSFDKTEHSNGFQLFASGRAGDLETRGNDDGIMVIHQDVALYGGVLDREQTLSQPLESGRGIYAVVVRGVAEINGTVIRERDAVALYDEETMNIKALENSEVLFMDVPLTQ